MNNWINKYFQKLIGNPVPPTFVLLGVIGIYFSGMSPVFILNEVLIRLCRDGILVLALIVPIWAGMGLNFAVVIGALAAQTGWLIILDYQIPGYFGMSLVFIISLLISLIISRLIGGFLNRVKGKEMISTMLIGFLGTGVYQLIFLTAYGRIIKCHNPEMLLSNGFGVRNMVDLAPYRNTFDKLFTLKIGNLEIPLFMIMIVLIFATGLKYLSNTRYGRKLKAAGSNPEFAASCGLNINKIRIGAITISTMLACAGQIFYLQNIGMINTYTAHLNSDIFSCATILVGGATVRNVKIRHVFIGIFLFHTLFIVSPQAGQNLFGNPALGEYFRSFVAYGAIAFALLFNKQIK